MKFLNRTGWPESSPPAWICFPEQDSFWQSISTTPGVLMLDYDGTLAPFHNEKMKALPYPGVAERLERIASLHDSRLVLISGRPVRELPILLPVSARLEAWGSHGRELKSPDGSYLIFQLPNEQEAALAAIRAELQQAGYSQSLEPKPTSLAVHWRSLSPSDQKNLSDLAESVFHRLAAGLDLECMQFECGLEYRAMSRNKGTVVKEILVEVENSGVLAYLGDDNTDEDAFAALKGRGTSWLVRSEPKKSFADFWLTPPEELLTFLDMWIQAKTSNGISG